MIESCQVAMGLNPGTPANIKMDKQNVYHQSTPKYGYEMVVVLECYRGVDEKKVMKIVLVMGCYGMLWDMIDISRI